MSRTYVLLLAASLALTACASLPRAAGPEPCLDVRAPRGTRVLVFTRVEGPPEHASIPAGLSAIDSLGVRHGFRAEHTADPAWFTDGRLRRYDAVVFLNTIDDVLDPEQEAAFERYIRAGGGFVGVHAAAHTEYDWEWYGRLVGAYYEAGTGPWVRSVQRVDSTHLSTRCVPADWRPNDEWVEYRSLPGAGVQILMTVDGRSSLRTLKSLSGGSAHPIAWAHEFDGGRAWYTAMGHRAESYADPAFLDHLAGGILWAIGR